MGRLLSIAACSLTLALAARAAAEPGPVTASLDLRALSEHTYQKLDGVALERRVMMRLVQEGFAVVSLERGGQVRLLLREAGPRALLLTAKTLDAERSRTIAWGAEPLEELHLELAQKAVELARPALAQRTVAAGPTATGSGPAAPAATTAATPAPATTGQPSSSNTVITPSIAQAAKELKPAKAADTVHIDGEAGAAFLYRGAATDPLFWGALRVGVYGGLGVHLLAGIAPASSGPVTATEVQLQVGLGYRYALHPRLDVEAALLLGALVHRFTVAAASTEPEGTRWNVLATLPVSLRWWWLAHVALGLRLAVGLADSGRTHTESGAILWKRNDFRIEGGLGLTVRFR